MTRLSLKLCLAALAASVLAGSSGAQTAGPGVPPNADAQGDKVTVIGRTAKESREVIDELAVKPNGVDALARWDKDVCTAIAGMSQAQADAMALRIAQRAHSIGLKPGGPGCKANIAIFVTADSDKLAARLFEEHKDKLAFYQNENEKTLGRAALRDFISEPRPIRWWHIAAEVGADGEKFGGGQARSNGTDGISGAATVRSDGSRLDAATRVDMAQAIIIIDSKRVQGVPLQAVADYAAMVALAQIAPDANMSGNTSVLNLFSAGASGETAKKGMSVWDEAYLDALYKAKRNASSLSQQKSELTRRMQK